MSHSGAVRISLLLTSLAFLLSACGDDGPAGPDPGADFDAVAAANSVEEMTAPPKENPDLTATLDLISGEVGEQAGLPALAAPIGVRDGRPAFDPGALERLEEELRSGGEADRIRASLLLPEPLLGTTLVWNPDTQDYEIDPERTDAPSNGIRFVMFAVNPITGRPAEPLSEIGFVDLLDESTADSGLRLRVRAVDTSGSSEVVLLDYFVEGTFVLAGESRVELAAEGFLSDGTDRVDFSLAQEITVPAGSSLAEGATSYRLWIEDGASLLLETTGSFDLQSGEAAALAVTLTLEEGADAVVLGVEFSPDGALDGSVSFNGEPVILVSGTVDEPEFTRPDGSALTESEREALETLLQSVEEILAFAESFFGVFGPTE